MSSFYCTAGRGTEKFACSECRELFQSSQVSVIDGKVFFTCIPKVTAEQINGLKSVERVFVKINYLPASEIAGKDKQTFVQSLCEKILNKDDVVVAFNTYSQLFAVNDDVESNEPASKKAKYEEGDNKNITTDTVPTFRISCKVNGRFKGTIHLQHLSQQLGEKIISSMGWRVDLKCPEIEINVHINDEHVTVGMPTSKNPVSKRNYIAHSGLRSTISWIICRLADIQPGDLVLDPLCGKATILVEGALAVKSGVFLGCDNNPYQLKHAMENRKSANIENKLQFLCCNSLGLPIRNNVIDRVVCDAPFGHKYTTDIKLEKFYSKLLREILRVLKFKGKAVVMTSANMRLFVLKQLKTLDSSIATSSTSDITSTASDKNTLPLENPETKGQISNKNTPSYEPETCGETEQGNENQNSLQRLQHSETTECTESDVKMKPIDDQSDSLSSVELKPSEETVSSTIDNSSDNNHNGKETHDTKAEANGGLTSAESEINNTSVNDDDKSAGSPTQKDKDQIKESQTDDAQLYLLEDHYVKLGETPAYLIVMQKC